MPESLEPRPGLGRRAFCGYIIIIIIMKIYTFTRDDETFNVEANSYEQALDTLIYYVGCEEQAALWTYRGE